MKDSVKRLLITTGLSAVLAGTALTVNPLFQRRGNFPTVEAAVVEPNYTTVPLDIIPVTIAGETTLPVQPSHGAYNPAIASAQDYTRIDYSNHRLQERIAEGVFEPGFLEGLEQMCARLDMDAMALLSVISHETGGTYLPDERNENNGNVGLLQFTEDNASYLGTSLSRLSQMSQREQLIYVGRHFERVASRRGLNVDFSVPENVALAVFYPAAVGNLSHIIGNRDSDRASLRRTYRTNSGLDLDGNGIITASDYVHPALDNFE